MTDWQLKFLWQDLKTANFETFFKETPTACEQLGGEGEEFCELLQSQLLQRLLKATTTGGKSSALNTSYLQKFIDAMVDFGESSGNADAEPYQLAAAIKTMLDPSSAPSKINEAKDLVLGSNHWLSKAFQLDNGKKVMKAASENADRRSELDSILTSIEEADVAVRSSIEEVETGLQCPENFGRQTLLCI